jgi:hypothetical protein
MRRCFLSFVALSLAACTKAAPPDSDGSAQPGSDRVVTIDDGADRPASETSGPRQEPGPPVDGVDELKSLEGLTEAQLVAELGEPNSKREFPMKECCTEFQIELYNTYPPDEPAHADVMIREWTWSYDGYAVTVWLHRVDETWVVLDTSRYSDDVEF